MTDSVVERVAKVIFEIGLANDGMAETWEVAPEKWKPTYRSQARAAIAAMREPTRAQLNAARDWSVRKYGIGVGNDGAIGCYQSMIDAALEEPHGQAQAD